MPWIQLRFATDEKNADRLSDALLDLGASAVTFEDAADQPLFEPPPGALPMWREVTVVALFEEGTDVDSVLADLSAAVAPFPVPACERQVLEDQDWERVWLTDFKPMQFGPRLWVVPTAYTPPDPNAVNILLDPGLAFGTGTHATTALCLGWLDANLDPAATVLDFGCGSGILAIAAAKLGAAKVWAVDIDPQAILATESNARANAVFDALSLHLPADFASPVVDVLVANILANPLVELSSKFAELVRPGGLIALSGILAEQADTVADAYRAEFDLAPNVIKDGWVLISGRRRDAQLASNLLG